MYKNDNDLLLLIIDNWSDILYDLSNPSGRSVYDAFWQDDRPYYTGISFMFLSVLLLIVHVIIYTFK